MTWLQMLACAVAALFIIYAAVELARGGGDPNHKDHDPLRGGHHLW
jgi:hypothetical protein